MGLSLFSIRPVAHQQQLDRLLVATAILAPVACLVAAPVALAWLDSWAAARFLTLSVAPLFLAAPLWARERLRAVAAAGPTRRWRIALDAAVVLLSIARFVVGEALPLSGHMLFLTYTGLLPASRPYRWLAVVLLAETTIFKLLIWADVNSWSIGLALGALAAGVVRWGESRPAT